MSLHHDADCMTEARCHAGADGEAARTARVEQFALRGAVGAELDAIVVSAARVLDSPVAAINALVGDEQRTLAHVGTTLGVLPRELSLCTHVVARQAQLVLSDASRDPFYARNPIIASDGSGFRSYCGVPIIAADDTILAVLCVLDTVARDFRRVHGEALQQLALVAARVLQAPRALELAGQAEAAVRPSEGDDPVHPSIDARPVAVRPRVRRGLLDQFRQWCSAPV